MRLSLRNPKLVETAAGLGALGIGASVYLFDRAGGARFVPAWLAPRFAVPPTPGLVGGSLPSFAHVFAFALLTAAVVGASRSAAKLACLVWVLVDVAFEVGQVDRVAHTFAVVSFPWGGAHVPFEYVRTYLLRGTFDSMDLCAAALGGLAAYLVIAMVERDATQCLSRCDARGG